MLDGKVHEDAVPVSPPPAPDQTPPAPDPFDPSRFRLSPALAVGLTPKKVLSTVPVRKPDKSWFVRVHPDPAFHLTTAVLELKDDREETYLVAPELWDELAGESTFSPRALYTAVNRQGVVFLWPVKLPRADGRKDEWSRSAREAVELATKVWVRVQANMPLGAYEMFRAAGTLPDPEWPAVSMAELLQTAFRDNYIDTLDHPAIRRLRGAV
jgi:hypothetical protein